MHKIVNGVDAWMDVLRNPERDWDKSRSRFTSAPVEIHHQPKFVLEPDAKAFCMGSCFARNVEEHLIYNGIDVLSRRIICPKDEYPYRINGLVNKFTTSSMLNEVRWAGDPPSDVDALMSMNSETTALDLQLGPGVKEVSIERARERRHYLLQDYFPRIFSADLVILTLGLDECWHDCTSGLYLNAAPSFWAVRREPDRYRVEILDVETNLAALEEMRRLLKVRNPAVRIVVTVSPVPLNLTFTGDDPALATIRAKSMLRTAAQQFSDAHGDVDYFPAYEMVTLSPRSFAYHEDCLHVTDVAVAEIMRRFISIYMGRASTAPAEFSEPAYLFLNPDVEGALRLGHFSSGFEHWLKHGKAEGRPLRPSESPAPGTVASIEA